MKYRAFIGYDAKVREFMRQRRNSLLTVGVILVLLSTGFVGSASADVPTTNSFPVSGADVSICANNFGAPRPGGRTHQGNDCFAPTGTPLLAVESGVVSVDNADTHVCGSTSGDLGGITVWLVGDSGTAYYYAHNSANEITSSGTRVGRGQVVAYVGNTGNACSTASHVHFEIHPGGRNSPAIDPNPYLQLWSTAEPPPPPRRVFGDWNGEGRADVSVWRPSTGRWMVPEWLDASWGGQGDIPVPADWNGDGRMDMGVFRPNGGWWFVPNWINAQFGGQGDIPVPADWNGDGLIDVGVFRPSTGRWMVPGWLDAQWGGPGDIPVPGDWNGDGRADVGVFRPSTGQWLVPGWLDAQWGGAGDIPVPADWNGDGRMDMGVFRPNGGWWLVPNWINAQWGGQGDIPVPADWNGDGLIDVGVFRPNGGWWLVPNWINGQWGGQGDIPVSTPLNAAMYQHLGLIT